MRLAALSRPSPSRALTAALLAACAIAAITTTATANPVGGPVQCGAPDEHEVRRCVCTSSLCVGGGCSAGRTTDGTAVVGYKSPLCSACRCVADTATLAGGLELGRVRALMGQGLEIEDGTDSARQVLFVADHIPDGVSDVAVEVQGNLPSWEARSIRLLPGTAGAASNMEARLGLEAGHTYLYRLRSGARAGAWQSLLVPAAAIRDAAFLISHPGAGRLATPPAAVAGGLGLALIQLERDAAAAAAAQGPALAAYLRSHVGVGVVVGDAAGKGQQAAFGGRPGFFSLDLVGVHFVFVPVAAAVLQRGSAAQAALVDHLRAAQQRRSNAQKMMNPWIVLVSDADVSSSINEISGLANVDLFVSAQRRSYARADIGTAMRLDLGGGPDPHPAASPGGTAVRKDAPAVLEFVMKQGYLEVKALSGSTVLDKFSLTPRAFRGKPRKVDVPPPPPVAPKALAGAAQLLHPPAGGGGGGAAAAVGVGGQPRLYIGVVSGSKNEDKRNACRETWAKDPRLHKVRFFVGRPKTDAAFDILRKEAFERNDIIILQFMEEDYDRIVYQTLEALRFGSQDPGASHVMKVDDDSYVHVDRLLAAVQRMPPQLSALGHFHTGGTGVARAGQWAVSQEEWPSNKYPPWAHGVGYVLTLDLAHLVAMGTASRASVKRDTAFRLEDVAVGSWIHYLKTVNGFSSIQVVSNRHFNFAYSCDPSFVVQHYVVPEKMRCMFKQSNQCCAG